MGKLRFGFMAGLATGYVLGTRAGRERYEQMKKAARTVADNPTVQQAAGAVQAQASGLASAAGTKIGDRVPGLRLGALGAHHNGANGSHAAGSQAKSDPAAYPASQ
jgi:hypothetical protein